jgi:translation initiation factor IF-1
LKDIFGEMFIDENKNFYSACIESLGATKLICELENSSVRLNHFSFRMQQKLFFV